MDQQVTQTLQLIPNQNPIIGSDLSRYGKNTIFAGIHYDISFMTIHGKSKFPGLYIWLRNGQKLRVVVPDGYLLVQAGRELEYLTGNLIILKKPIQKLFSYKGFL